MQVFAETERLLLREFLPEDALAFFEMDSDPEVHRYLGNNTVKTIEEVYKTIELVRQQYTANGIGRWAAVKKDTGEVVGWSGLKFITEPENGHNHFYDVGYRLLQKHWGQGYATESARAAIEYGFTEMNLAEIIGTAHVENARSIRALQKCGLIITGRFDYKDIPCHWMRITRAEWDGRQEPGINK